jgi:hypothetical protein
MKITSALVYSTQRNLSFKIYEAIKIFHDKQTKTIYDHQVSTTEDSTRNSATEDESKQNHERMESIKPQKKRQVIRE